MKKSETLDYMPTLEDVLDYLRNLKAENERLEKQNDSLITEMVDKDTRIAELEDELERFVTEITFQVELTSI